MPEGKTAPEEKYYALCLHFIEQLLPEFMRDVIFNKENGSSFDSTINNASNVVNAGTAAAAIATTGVALAAAPITFGASLTLLPTLLTFVPTIRQGGRSFQRLVTTLTEEKKQTTLIGESYGDLFRAYQSLLTRVAYLCSHRYAEPLTQRCEEKGITEFAHFTVEYLIKKLGAAINKKTMRYNTLPDAETVANWLLESKNISILHQPKKITLKKEYRNVSRVIETPSYAKWLGSRALIAETSTDPKTGEPTLRYYGSPNEKMYAQPTTLSTYGMIVLPFPKHTQLVTNTTLKRIEDEDILTHFKTHLVPHLSIFFTVTLDDMLAYLADRRSPSSEKKTLNTYLSEKYGFNIIAECHDNRFKDKDLSYGDFSYAYFDKICFEQCNLSHTVFEKTRLYSATFLNSRIDDARFSHCYAADSLWDSMVFSGAFTQVNFSGATFDNSEYREVFLHCNFEDLLLGMMIMQKPLTENNASTLTETDMEDLLLDMRTIQGQVIENNASIIASINESRMLIHASLPSTPQSINQPPTLRSSTSTTSFQDPLNPLAKDALYKQLRTLSVANYYTKSYQNDKNNLIALNVQSANPTTPDTCTLSEALEDFCYHSSSQIKIITAKKGYGKTFSATLWLEELQLQFENEDDWLPIPIRLTELISKTPENFLLTCLCSLGFNSTTIQDVFQSNVFFIIDGLQELQHSTERYIIEECLLLNQLWTNNQKKLPKFLFFAETNVLYDSDYLTWLRYDQHTPLSWNDELIIQPLTEEQIKQYTDYYCNKYPSFQSQYETFRRQEKKIEESPLSLHILCTILSQELSHSLPSKRFEFYSTFQSLWFRHIERQATSNNISQKNLIAYDNRVALTLFENKMPFIERNPNEIDTLFSDRQDIKTHYLCPYTITRTHDSHEKVISRITYTNDTFRCYSLARALIDLLFSEEEYNEKIRHWGADTLSNKPDTLLFIRDYYTTQISQASSKRRVIIENTLLRMIYASKSDSASPTYYASNAITVLNFDYIFSIKLARNALDGIRIPNAILSYGRFEHMYLTNADFTNVDFTGATLINTDFSQSNMDGVSFLNASDAIFTEGKPSAIAIRPARTPIIAYAIGKYIFIDNPKHRYTSFEAHLTPISALAWGLIEGSNKEIIVSAAINGSIRVWQVGTDGNVNGLHKLNSNTNAEPLHIALSPNGHYLAATYLNGDFLIWDIESESVIYTFKLTENDYGNRIVWTKKNQRIFLACTDSNVYYWSTHWDIDQKLKLTHHTPLTLNQIEENLNFCSTHLSSSKNNTQKPPYYSKAITAMDIGQLDTAPQQEYLALSYGNTSFYIINTTIQESMVSKHIGDAHRGPIIALACRGNVLISSSKNDYSIKLWRIHTANSPAAWVAELITAYVNHNHPVTSLQWGNDDYFVTNGMDDMLLIRDRHSPSTLPPKTVFQTPITQLKIKENILFCGEVSGDWWTIDLIGPRPYQPVLLSNDDSLQFADNTKEQTSSTNLYIATIGPEKNILISDTKTKQTSIKEVDNKPLSITWVFWRNTEYLFIGSSSGIEMYSATETGIAKKPTIILPYPATQLVFCSPHLWIAHDRVIFILNLEKLEKNNHYCPIDEQIGVMQKAELTNIKTNGVKNISKQNALLTKARTSKDQTNSYSFLFTALRMEKPKKQPVPNISISPLQAIQFPQQKPSSDSLNTNSSNSSLRSKLGLGLFGQTTPTSSSIRQTPSEATDSNSNNSSANSICDGEHSDPENSTPESKENESAHLTDCSILY